MTRSKISEKDTPSITSDENQSNVQGQIPWNGNYNAFLAHRLRMQAMAHSKSTILNPISLINLEKLLSKSMATIGIETNRLKKQCNESTDSKDKGGEQ